MEWNWPYYIVIGLLIEGWLGPIRDIVRAFGTTVINHCCCSENCGCRDED
jgi:hypothetical protein